MNAGRACDTAEVKRAAHPVANIIQMSRILDNATFAKSERRSQIPWRLCFKQITKIVLGVRRNALNEIQRRATLGQLRSVLLQNLLPWPLWSILVSLFTSLATM